MTEIGEWMGDARLDRLEEGARAGHASPAQMLKLIAEVRRRRAAERAAQGLELYPLATWHAFAPDQLVDLITGVTRCDPVRLREIMNETVHRGSYEFGTERRDLSGALIGGALWRAERDGVSSFKLHLLQSEPRGVA